jgi:hypothetical protein
VLKNNKQHKKRKYYADLFFWIDALKDILFSGSFYQLTRGDMELPDEGVIATAVVVEALDPNVAILKNLI